MAIDKHLKIVCIGGGTGLHTILPGIRAQFHDAKLSAVVSMMDSGGSTGRLRDEFGYLPPGDLRRSLVALSAAPQELRALMEYRFKTEGSGLTKHVVGNILLTALKELHGGDEYAAVEAMERILRLRGKVFPVTLTNCHLVATLQDGTRIKGETNIDIPKHNPELRITKLHLEPSAEIFEKTENVIAGADYILIGPGDLYTSIMPNLIVDGMVAALKKAKARGAKILYIANTMTKYGETNDFKTSDFLRIVQDALDGATIDAVIMNTGIISDEQSAAYAAEKAKPVEADLKSSTALIVIAQDVVNTETFARHDPAKLATALKVAIRVLNGDVDA